MEPSISFVTLGVTDVARTTRFYDEGLGLPRLQSLPSVSFFNLGTIRLAVYLRDLLAADAGVAAEGSDFPRFALSHNVGSPGDVDQLLQVAVSAGGSLAKPARRTEWGGYAGYFADPDGFLWEVVWNPKMPPG